MVLFFGVMLAILAVVLNVIFIPVYGIEGSAFATFLAVFVYNTIKIYFVKQKFNMQPFTMASLKIVLTLIVLSLAFYFWEFPFHPIVNIILKSIVIGLLYFSVIYKMNVSEDVSSQIKKYLRLK
jgi:O-antigen/teichoic acid export membrane protein